MAVNTKLQEAWPSDDIREFWLGPESRDARVVKLPTQLVFNWASIAVGQNLKT